MRQFTQRLVWLLLLVLSSCARDKAGPTGGEAKPVQITIRYTLEGNISSDLFYFFVFNFSNSPKRDESSRPQPYVSGPDRGKNWERYVVFHGASPTTSPTNAFTLQREDLPKLTPVGKAPKDIIYADMNADNNVDLITANSGDDTVSVIMNNGDGTFRAAANYPAGDEPTRLISLDYDADGDIDIAVTNFADSEIGRSVKLLLNDGTGKLSEGISVSFQAQPLGITQADFNGDGKNDLAVTLFTDSEQGNKVAVLLRTDEGFGEPIYTAVGRNPNDIVAFYYDEDAVADLAVLNGFDGEGGNSLTILKGNGDGTFIAAFEPSLATGRSPASFAYAPLNEDRFVDFVVANSYDGEGGNSVSVFLSNEDGTYNEASTISVGTSPTHVILFDLNRDGTPELIVTESGTNLVRRFLGQQGGQFTEPVTAPTGRTPLRSLLFDYDKNGFPDLAVVNSFDGSAGNSFTILDGTEQATFKGAVLYWTDEIPHAIANEPWFRGINVGPNFIELKIDPALFTDLLGREPENFLVDFLVATTGIDKETNPLDFGDELDWLSQPVVVQVQRGFNTDEARENLEKVENTPIAPPPEADIIDWSVEVQ